MSEQKQEPRERIHPDIFTPDEAVSYLRLESERTLDWLQENFGLRHQVIGSVRRYHREDLDACALRAFGKGEQVEALRLAGGRR